MLALSNPGKLNAMSRAMWRGLRDVFAGLALRCAGQAADRQHGGNQEVQFLT